MSKTTKKRNVSSPESKDNSDNKTPEAKKPLEEMTPEELIDALKQKDAQIEKLNEQATQTINSLSVKLDETTKKKAVKNPVCKLRGQSFEIVVPRFQLDGVVYLAEDLENDSEVLAELHAIGSHIIKPLK